MEWIKSTDKLPKTGYGIFIIAYKNPNPQVSNAYFYGDSWSISGCAGGDMSLDKVSHWMPYPEHPKQRYYKKCIMCGQFVPKDRWIIKKLKVTSRPMCSECVSCCDDPYGY